MMEKGLRSWRDGSYGYMGIAPRGVTKEKIAGGAVTTPKLDKFGRRVVISPYGYILFHQWHGDLPLAWGGYSRWERLTDFGYGMWWPGDYYGIGNYTGDWKELWILYISHGCSQENSSEPMSKFYLVYNTQNGWIIWIAKSEKRTVLPPLPPGHAYYDLESDPQGEEIFSNPWDYIFDLKEGKMRKKL